MSDRVSGEPMVVGKLNFYPTKQVRVVVRPEIDSKSLHAALDKILGLAGCTQCGLNGFDLNIVRGDPVLQQLGEAKEIASITLETRPL